MSATDVASAVRPEDFEAHRRALTGYCYRMLGSAFEAEDAVQETMVRAWRATDSYEGRSSLRSWLYRIATNVCLDLLRGRRRRALPLDVTSPSTTDAFSGSQRPEAVWISPIPDDRVVSPEGDPAELAVAKETIRLAFVTALQHLPPRQRAVLILREVLRCPAGEVAELLDTSVVSVNSALQRARATLATRDLGPAGPMGADQQALLASYVAAFERYDVARLVRLLRDDVVQTMPPYDHWLVGAEEVGRWLLGPGIECRGSRLLATAGCGTAAFGQYRVDPAGGHAPWSLQIIETSGDRITGLHNFLDTRLFAVFGLPARLGPEDQVGEPGSGSA